MPGRDWQADWELCQHQEIKQLPRLAWREIEKLNVGSWQVKATILAITYLDKALEGWPVALEERTRLEERARELETQVAALRKALQDLLAVDNIPTGEYDSSLMGVKDNAREALASSELERA